ncbi:MAG TPA: hypothetical protein VMA36_03545 [Candidatus Limnocylindria bacterium]|nr:hypothetical protein [Candidatus Limnocylindria bacterium]
MTLCNRLPAWRAVALAIGIAGLAAPAAAQTTKPLTPSQMVSPDILVKRIDLNCQVFHNAIQTVQPTEVAAIQAASWTVVDAAHKQQVESMKDHVWIVQVWKQAGNLNWVHSARLDARGARHATQLCFRNDGTLARARQATTIPGLDAASARQAYFNTDGSVIRASSLFEVNDPAIGKRVDALPYFKLVMPGSSPG